MKMAICAISKWLTGSIILLMVACRKDGHEPPIPPETQYDVITTGAELNSTTIAYDPVYWINDQRIPLDKGTWYEAFPYGIEKAGNDLYITGMYVAAGNNIGMPCYWQNGVKKELPVDGLNITLQSGSRDAKWFNNALYILGDVDLSPVIWKIKGNNITIIPIKSNSAVTQAIAVAMNLEVYNNKLWFGCTRTVTNAGNTFLEAGYWEIGTDDKMTYHTLESNLLQALCYSLAISDKGVFIAGEFRDNVSTPYPAPVVWTKQGRMPVINQVNINSQRINEVQLDATGKLYLNILDYANTQPLVWKVTGNNYEPLSATIPAGAKGYCNNIAVYDNKLAYAYTYHLNNKVFAAYRFNNKQVELNIGNVDFLSIHRTSIFPK